VTLSADHSAAVTSAVQIRFAGIGDEAGSPISTQLAALDELGWDAIELRTVDRTAIADLDDIAFARLVATLQMDGIRVVGVASRIGGWSRPATGDLADDLTELDVLAERCRVLGTRHVRVMSYSDGGLDDAEWGERARARLRLLAHRAEAAGLILVHENCTGWAGSSADRMLELLDYVGSPALRLLFDTGNGVPYGYDAYELLRRILPHVAHVHLKDALPGPTYVPAGEGVARVAACVNLLLEHGYAGPFSMEPHVSLRPHEGDYEPDFDTYVACGRALEELFAPQWTTIG
jgi:sugar phosphate isomerase/epimerase